MKENTFQPNPELYEKLKKPFASIEEAEKAQNEFADEVRKLREKYKIAEVVLLSQVYIREGGDEDISARSGSHTCGDMMEAIRLVHSAAFNFSISTIGQLANDIAELRANKEIEVK